jgi:hypothetical protein
LRTIRRIGNRIGKGHHRSLRGECFGWSGCGSYSAEIDLKAEDEGGRAET